MKIRFKNKFSFIIRFIFSFFLFVVLTLFLTNKFVLADTNKYWSDRGAEILSSQSAKLLYSPICRAAIEGVSWVRYIYGPSEYVLLGAPSLTLSLVSGGPYGVVKKVSWDMVEEIIKKSFHHPEKTSKKIAKATYDLGLNAYRENYRLYKKVNDGEQLTNRELRTFVLNWYLSAYMTAAKKLYNDISAYERKDDFKNPSKLLLQSLETQAIGSAKSAFGSMAELEVSLLIKSTKGQFSIFESLIGQAAGLGAYPPYKSFLSRISTINKDIDEALKSSQETPIGKSGIPVGLLTKTDGNNIDVFTAQSALPYADLSLAAYSDGSRVGDWHRIEEEEQRNLISGLHASTFSMSEANGRRKIAIVFEGTNMKSVRDWLTNISQLSNTPISNIPNQYNEALKYADKIIKKYDNENTIITICGHSLGGGLAQFSAGTLGARAYTFNTAGLGPVSALTVLQKGNFANAEIVHIITEGVVIDDIGSVKRKKELVSSIGAVLGNVYTVPIENDRPMSIGALHNMEKLRDAIRAIVLAGEKKPLQNGSTIIAVVDSSGSMTSTDPKNLRISALEMMLDSLDDATRLGIIDFDSNAKIITTPGELGPLNGLVRSQLKEKVRQIDSAGGTDIRKGLTAGVDLIGNNPSNVVIVLLTDGRDGSKMSWADKAGVAPAGTPVHTIALSEKADRRGLSVLSATTNGISEIARDANDLQRIFASLFGMAEGEEVILVREGNIQNGEKKEYIVFLEKGLGIADFRVSWPGSDIDLSVSSPQGQIYSIEQAVMKGYGSEGETYDILRIKNPVPGAWKVQLHGADIPGAAEPFSLRVSGKDTAIRCKWKMEPKIPVEGHKIVFDIITEGEVAWERAEIQSMDPTGKQKTETSALTGVAGVLGSSRGQTVWRMRVDHQGVYRIRLAVYGKTRAGYDIVRSLDRSFSVAKRSNTSSEPIFPHIPRNRDN